MTENILIKVAKSNDELIKAFLVRGIVFMGEQNCPYFLEFDGEDFSATHIIGLKNDEPLAAARIRFLGEYAKVERLCVRQEFRRRGIGGQMTKFALGHAESIGYSIINVHAQTHLEEFYNNFGFHPVGNIFKEAGIDHRLMIKSK